LTPIGAFSPEQTRQIEDWLLDANTQRAIGDMVEVVGREGVGQEVYYCQRPHA
jgi:hypothetical protein